MVGRPMMFQLLTTIDRGSRCITQYTDTYIIHNSSAVLNFHPPIIRLCSSHREQKRKKKKKREKRKRKKDKERKEKKREQKGGPVETRLQPFERQPNQTIQTQRPFPKRREEVSSLRPFEGLKERTNGWFVSALRGWKRKMEDGNGMASCRLTWFYYERLLCSSSRADRAEQSRVVVVVVVQDVNNNK